MKQVMWSKNHTSSGTLNSIVLYVFDAFPSGVPSEIKEFNL